MIDVVISYYKHYSEDLRQQIIQEIVKYSARKFYYLLSQIELSSENYEDFRSLYLLEKLITFFSGINHKDGDRPSLELMSTLHVRIENYLNWLDDLNEDDFYFLIPFIGIPKNSLTKCNFYPYEDRAYVVFYPRIRRIRNFVTCLPELSLVKTLIYSGFPALIITGKNPISEEDNAKMNTGLFNHLLAIYFPNNFLDYCKLPDLILDCDSHYEVFILYQFLSNLIPDIGLRKAMATIVLLRLKTWYLQGKLPKISNYFGYYTAIVAGNQNFYLDLVNKGLRK